MLFIRREIVLILLSLTALVLEMAAQESKGIGIGTEDVNTDAVLEIESTDKGLLIPRMTTIKRTAIGASSVGLIVYDTTKDALYYYDGSSWLRLVVQPAQVNLDMNSHKIINVSNGTASKDAVNKGQMDVADNLRLKKAGDTMSGNLNMGSKKITSVANGTSSKDAVNRGQLNAKASRIQPNWVDLELSNGWESGSGGRTAQYFKDHFGIVHFRGLLDPSLATSKFLAKIPASHSPGEKPGESGLGHYFPCMELGANIAVKITVQTSIPIGDKADLIAPDDYQSLSFIDLSAIHYDTRNF